MGQLNLTGSLNVAEGEIVVLMGLSGWFYLLVFIPTVGALIVLVFTLIPSQARENRWGPVPAGAL